MALEITATETAKLTVQGTSTELPSLYSRLSCQMTEDGKTMNTRLFNYGVKQNYLDGETSVNIAELNPKYALEVDTVGGETQSITLANQKMKALLEAKGYTVVITDLPS